MSYWPYEVPRLIARSGIRLLINGRKTNCECNCLLILNGNPHSLFFNLLADKDINCYGKCTYFDTWMEWWANTFLLDAQRLYFFKTGLDPWITLDLSIIIKKNWSIRFIVIFFFWFNFPDYKFVKSEVFKARQYALN